MNTDTSPDNASFKAIWRLTWPQMLMMVFHFCIGFADVVVAGRINREVQASLGMITQSLMFFLIIAIAVANGAVAAVSQSVGARLPRRVRLYVGLCLTLALGCGGLFVLIATPLKPVLLHLLQVPESVRPVADYFLGVYLATLPAYYMLIITNAIFRAHRWVFVPLFAMITVTVVNTLLDFGLGLGMWGLPRLEHKGLAWATFVSVLCGAAFNLFTLRRRGLLGLYSLPPLRWAKPAIRYLFKVAWPAGAMQVLWHSAYLCLYAITASLPVDQVAALAAMTAGMRIEAFLFMPGFAFNMTASILVGNLLGAGNAAQAKRTGYAILASGVGLMSVVALVLWNWVEPIAGFVASDADVASETVNYLFYNFLGIPFTVGTMILGGVMVGAGATVYNLVIFGVSAWCVRIPLAYILGHAIMGEPTGVWLAMLISMAVQAPTLLFFFHFKDWSRFAMRKQRRKPQAGLAPLPRPA